MSRDSSGNCTRTKTGGYVAGTSILEADVNSEINDIIAMLTESLSRNGKGALQANLDAGGYKITNLAAATANGQAVRYDEWNAAFPAGTKLPFYQASPPAGWSAVTINSTNDYMMRVVPPAGAGGTYGGTNNPVVMNLVPSHTHSISVTTSSDAHTHNFLNSATYSTNDSHPTTNIAYIVGDPGSAGLVNGATVESLTYLTTDTHDHTVSGSTGANAGATNWQPRYADFCVGQKT